MRHMSESSTPPGGDAGSGAPASGFDLDALLKGVGIQADAPTVQAEVPAQLRQQAIPPAPEPTAPLAAMPPAPLVSPGAMAPAVPTPPTDSQLSAPELFDFDSPHPATGGFETAPTLDPTLRFAASTAGHTAPPAVAAPASPAVDEAAARRGTMHDNLEEVLHQTSDQTLKLAHFEEHLRRVERAVGDMHEEVVAGLMEMRSVGNIDTVGNATGELERSLGGRIEEVELVAAKTSRLLSRLLWLGAVQLVALVALAVVLWMSPSDSQDTRAPRTPEFSGMGQSVDGGDVGSMEQPRKSKKRRRRRAP